MGYRSLKRVLGETSLERKCRLLFGTCLFLLISGAFIWVDKIAEEQVRKSDLQKRASARKTARSFADTSMVKLHFLKGPNYNRSGGDSVPVVAAEQPESTDIRESMLTDMESHEYQADVLGPPPVAGNIVVPIASEEMVYIDKLLEEKRQRDLEQAKRLEEQGALADAKGEVKAAADALEKEADDAAAAERAESADSADSAAGSDSAKWSDGSKGKRRSPRSFITSFLGAAKQEEAEAPSLNLPIATDAVMEDDDDNQYYAYYQLVEWTPTCKHCHPNTSVSSTGALSAAESGLLAEDPLRVVRIIFPHQWTPKEGVNRIRAILTSASILTFFVAMIALYVIVRYVIVKPLQHLRDVSDEISRGETGLRAEIHTNDEFEDLADSFNRMLRHLTDTQENLRGVNSDLDAKVDELAQLNMQLHEMNRLKSDFLANMSHELRTPLNSIIGFSEVLSGIDSLSDKQRRYAKNIQNSGRVLLEMINDILDLAKVEAGKMELRPSEFQIGAIVSAQCDMVRSLSEEKNIDLLVEVSDNLPGMYQDQGKVQQILTNLLSNAIKFTPEGGRINVSVEPRSNNQVLMVVEDTGVGIPEEDRDIIFEKFRQSNTVLGDDGLTREYSGTGLGLSIVKELSRLLKGEIWFDSEVGKGSRFMVQLPCDVSVGHPVSPSEKEQPLPDPAAAGPGTSRW